MDDQQNSGTPRGGPTTESSLPVVEPAPALARTRAAELPVPAEPAPGTLQPNQLFGKYRVVRDLGAGGMAQVFLAAIDGPEGFQKQCVVKKILPEFAKDPSFAQMFIVEARVAAMMSHQNIVHVFEFSKLGDEFFLAMEYVPGASLHRIMRAARKLNLPLGPRVSVEIGIAMAQALQYAHSFVTPEGQALDIVHRDVSPENILVSRDGAVKLTDFGVVKSAMNSQNTVAGVVKGKWSYMSPEQVSSRPVDKRSDLFSLGIVLHETAVGRKLFRGDSLAATVNAVSLAEIPLPSSIVPGFPPALERIILKALHRDPAQRYQSGAELAAALEQFRANQTWTSGGKHLASIVNTLFPRDGSQPGVNLMPGSGSSEVAGRESTADGDAPAVSGSHIDISVRDEPEVGGGSTPALIAGGAIAIIASALFWYFAIS